MHNHRHNVIKKVLLLSVFLGMLPTYYYYYDSVFRENGGLASFFVSSLKADSEHKRSCLLLSSFRSGSSFLGSALSRNRETFFFYEPFHAVKFLYKPLPNIDELHIDLLRHYINCNLTVAETVYNKTGKFGYFRWMGKKTQGDLNEASGMCRRLPYQVIKTVRLRGKQLEKLMEDHGLDVKVIMLVRDPRGMYLSRMDTDFCKGQRCRNLTLMCQQMEQDYIFGTAIQNKYPARIMTVRLEEVTSNLLKYMKLMTEFCGLPFSNETRKFIDGSNNKTRAGLKSTQGVPFQWIEMLNYRYIKNVQDSCTTVMKVWGYKSITRSQFRRRFTLELDEILNISM